MSIHKLIDACERGFTTGDVKDSELDEIMHVAFYVLSHIEQFIEDYGDDWADYPEEFFYRDKRAANDALKIFGDMLSEIEDYLYE